MQERRNKGKWKNRKVDVWESINVGKQKFWKVKGQERRNVRK